MGRASLFQDTNGFVIKTHCHMTAGCWEAVVMTPEISDVQSTRSSDGFVIAVSNLPSNTVTVHLEGGNSLSLSLCSIRQQMD